jgi:ribosomal protein S18 acetylase RimI-like enzyme
VDSPTLHEPRPLGVEDAPEVARLVEACDIEAIGRPDYTVDELEADLRSTDVLLLGWYDDDGLLGYGWLDHAEGSEKVRLDLYPRPGADPSFGEAAMAHLEELAARLVAAAGFDEVFLDVGAYRQDARSRSLLQARGFEVATSFVRMRLDLRTPAGEADPAAAAEPAVVPGVDIAEVPVDAGGEADLRAAHRVNETALAEHYAHVDEPYDKWRSRLTELGPDWSRVWLARLDGEPVGLLLGTRQFEPDEDAGYVRSLAVLPSVRGRGIATALLRTYVAVSAAAGRSAVLLHVDVANTTKALRLYESVGMRAFLTIDAWAKRSPTTSD